MSGEGLRTDRVSGFMPVVFGEPIYRRPAMHEAPGPPEHSPAKRAKSTLSSGELQLTTTSTCPEPAGIVKGMNRLESAEELPLYGSRSTVPSATTTLPAGRAAATTRMARAAGSLTVPSLKTMRARTAVVRGARPVTQLPL